MAYIAVIRTKTTERLDPSGDLAFCSVTSSKFAPVADLDIVGRFHDVGDVVAWVHLEESTKIN